MSKAKKITSEKKQSSNPYGGREGLVYIRVSSKKQETEGTGLESQEGRCLKELINLSVPYVRSFPDSFTGGGDFMKRPAMAEMLGFIDKHPHKKFVVIFDDLKRFARDVEFHLKLRSVFKARNVTLRCLNYNFDESPEGRFAETVMAGHAELERHQNRRQVIQKQKSRLELGYWSFGSKKGYTMVKDAEHGKISIPNKQGLEILKPTLEKFAKGAFVSKVEACRFLVREGVWTKQSPEKYIDKFTSILKDPFYAGFIEYPAWEVPRIKGKHKGIISIETFDLIQKRLRKEDSGQRVRIDMREDFPLRGLLNCADCGHHITGAWTQGKTKKYPYYFCQNKLCISYQKIIRKKDIEDEFATLLTESELEGQPADYLERFDRVWKEELNNFKEYENVSIQQKKVLEDKITELTNLMVNSKSDLLKRTYEKQIEKTAKELQDMEENFIKELDFTDSSIPYQTAFNKAIGFLKSPYTIWVDLDIHEQHRLFYFISNEKLTYSRIEGYRTPENLSSKRLFEDFATSSSQDVDMSGKILNFSKLKDYLKRFWQYYQNSPKFQKTLEKILLNPKMISRI